MATSEEEVVSDDSTSDEKGRLPLAAGRSGCRLVGPEGGAQGVTREILATLAGPVRTGLLRTLQ